MATSARLGRYFHREHGNRFRILFPFLALTLPCFGVKAVETMLKSPFLANFAQFFATFAVKSFCLNGFSSALRTDFQLLSDLLPLGNASLKFCPMLLEFSCEASGFLRADEGLERRLALRNRRFQSRNFFF
jgi:hypothetical protein